MNIAKTIMENQPGENRLNSCWSDGTFLSLLAYPKEIAKPVQNSNKKLDQLACRLVQGSVQ